VKNIFYPLSEILEAKVSKSIIGNEDLSHLGDVLHLEQEFQEEL
jgi:hypothetical protein